MEVKLNIGDPKSKRTYTKPVSEDAAAKLANKKIGDTFRGELIDLPGYEFVITGGSDASGFPMRKGIHSANRKRILTQKGVGFRNIKFRKKNNTKVRVKISGARRKISIRGEVISNETAQINCKVSKPGTEDLEKIFPKKEAAAKPAE